MLRGPGELWRILVAISASALTLGFRAGRTLRVGPSVCSAIGSQSQPMAQRFGERRLETGPGSGLHRTVTWSALTSRAGVHLELAFSVMDMPMYGRVELGVLTLRHLKFIQSAARFPPSTSAVSGNFFWPSQVGFKLATTTATSGLPSSGAKYLAGSFFNQRGILHGQTAWATFVLGRVRRQFLPDGLPPAACR